MQYYFIWILFAMLHGVYDGIMYAHFDYSKPIAKGIKHPHVTATLLRLTVLASIFIATQDYWLLAACALAFSLWHNGMYYEGRRFLGYDLYHFFSTSSTSTGFGFILFGKRIRPFEMSFIQRTVYFILSIAIIVYRYYYHGK